MTSLNPADNRRTAVRIVAHDILRIMSSLSRLHDGDVIKSIVFTGIWTLNTRHLIEEPGRYSALHDLPPDTQRRPAEMAPLRQLTSVPEPLLSQYVEMLIADGLVERLPGGLVAPSAVFTRPEMLDGSNEVQTRMIAMFSNLRSAGVSLGEAA